MDRKEFFNSLGVITAFRAAAILAAAVLFCACGVRKYAAVDASSPYQKPSDCFRIVSYNVGAFGKYIPDMGENVAMVAAMLGEVGADAVTLNELDSLNGRHEAFELQALADSLVGWEYHFSSSMPYRGGAYGNGVVLPKGTKILDRYTLHLPQSIDNEPRSVSVIETEDYVIGGVHLGLVPSVQLEQVEVINAWARERYASCGDKPVFLCGDMNAVPGSATILALEKDWERLSTDEFSFDSRTPDICIDHIFRYRLSAPVEVLGAATMSSFTRGDATLASDHLPIYIDLKF